MVGKSRSVFREADDELKQCFADDPWEDQEEADAWEGLLGSTEPSE